MPTSARLDEVFAHGVAHILTEIAKVQPDLDEESEDPGAYAMFDGTEIPIISSDGLMIAKQTNMAGHPAMYIEVPVNGRIVLVLVMERRDIQATDGATK